MGEKQDKSKSSERESSGIQEDGFFKRNFKKLTAPDTQRPGDQGSYNRQDGSTTGAPQQGGFNRSAVHPLKSLMRTDRTRPNGQHDRFVDDEGDSKVGKWFKSKGNKIKDFGEGAVAIGGGALTLINPLNLTEGSRNFFGLEKTSWAERKQKLGAGTRQAFKKCAPATKDIFKMYMVVQTGGVTSAIGKGAGKRVLVNIFETPFMDSMKSKALQDASPETKTRALTIMNIVKNCTSDPTQLAGVLSGSSTDGFGRIANMTSDQKSSVYAIALGGDVDVITLMNASQYGLLDKIPLDKIGAVKTAWEQQEGAKGFLSFLTLYNLERDKALRELAEEAQVAMKPQYRSPQSWHNNFERVLKQDNGVLAKWVGGETGDRKDPASYERTTRAATLGLRFTKASNWMAKMENGITVESFKNSVKSRLTGTFSDAEKTKVADVMAAAFAEYTAKNPYVNLTQLFTVNGVSQDVQTKVINLINANAGAAKFFDVRTDAGYDNVYEYSLKYAKTWFDPRKPFQDTVQNFSESQDDPFEYEDLDECTSMEDCEHCETEDLLGRYYFIPDLKEMVESGVAEPICINILPGAGDSDDDEWVQLEDGLEHEGHLEDLFLLPPTEPTNPSSGTAGIQDADEEFQSWRHLILEIWEKGDRENLLVDLDFAEVVPQGCIKKVIYDPYVRWRQGCEDVYVSFYCYDTELGTPDDDDLLREYSDIGDFPFPADVDVENLRFRIREPREDEELEESTELGPL